MLYISLFIKYVTIWYVSSEFNRIILKPSMWLDFTYQLNIYVSFTYIFKILEVQFSHSVMSNCLQPHGLQHVRLPCPSPSPGACLNSCPLSQWCHPSILASGIPFSSCLHSFQALRPFPMSWLFASGGQSIRGSASVLPMTLLLIGSALFFWSTAILLRI